MVRKCILNRSTVIKHRSRKTDQNFQLLTHLHRVRLVIDYTVGDTGVRGVRWISSCEGRALLKVEYRTNGTDLLILCQYVENPDSAAGQQALLRVGNLYGTHHNDPLIQALNLNPITGSTQILHGCLKRREVGRIAAKCSSRRRVRWEL